MRQSEEGDDGDGEGDNDGGGESDEEGAGPMSARDASTQPLAAQQSQGVANAALACTAGAPPANEQSTAMPLPAAADSAAPSAAAAGSAASEGAALSTGVGRDAARESFGEQDGDEPIWSRTRARQPLEHVTLDELEALLGEVNDDQLWPALVDEDAAYQQFLDVRVPMPEIMPHEWCMSSMLSCEQEVVHANCLAPPCMQCTHVAPMHRALLARLKSQLCMLTLAVQRSGAVSH